MSDGDVDWLLRPRGLFESRRRYRRRVAEMEQRFLERHDGRVLPGGEKAAVLRQQPPGYES